jgi:hypothetical protein
MQQPYSLKGTPMNLPNLTRIVFLTSLLMAFGASPIFAQNKFVPDCTPPFEATPHPHRVDKFCRNEGKFEDNATDEHRAQNRAKNSFCAKGSGGMVAANPITVTATTFDILQQKVVQKGIQFGSSASLPKDRDALKDIATNADGVSIGEGSYVVFVGHMLEAHPTGKESVSCQKGAVGFADIHIALVGTDTNNVCKSITAEIIPHYRPASWPRIYFADHYQEILQHPLRIKGQLFFDGSHRPCGDPQKSFKDPKRRSSWEIHPVYSIDVCSNTSISGCKANDESVWTPFDEWINSQ